MADKVSLGEALREPWARFVWALKPWHWTKITPYQTGGDQDPEKRTGIADLGHALVNIPVEVARVKPQFCGKFWLWQTAVTLLLVISMISAAIQVDWPPN